MSPAHLIFILGMIAIPFSGVRGISALGELRTELSVYFFIIALLICMASAVPQFDKQGTRRFAIQDLYLLPQISFCIIAVIIFSLIPNFYHIATDNFRERAGFPKFVTSTMVVMYGLAIAVMTYHLSKQDWPKLIVRPIAISILICACYSVFELLSFQGIMKGFYMSLMKIVHGGFATEALWDGEIKWEQGWDTRLRSVSFEPPAFANFACLALPWIYAGILSSKGSLKKVYILIMALLLTMIAFCGARTAMVMTGGMFIAYLILKFSHLPRNPGRNYSTTAPVINFLLVSSIIIFISGLILGIEPLINAVIAGTSNSNISRLASQLAAYQMFFSDPVFGLGFGQYGFHVGKYLPYWGYYSWELQPWLIYPEAPWPAVYSIYARFAAELGILGLFGWLGLWFWLMKKVVQQSRHYQQRFGHLPPMAYPLVLSCVCVLLSGISTDTIRTPMIWVNLGLCCRYLYETRRSLLSLTDYQKSVFFQKPAKAVTL